MGKSVAELLVDILADAGVQQIFGVVGDALNPLTDAIRRDRRIEWIGVRHEEGAALAAAGQAKLTGRLAVCAGTTGPGGNHLVAGLYEAQRDHAPVLALTGDMALERHGIDYLQTADHNELFRDVTLYTEALVAPEQAPHLIHQAILHAYAGPGVAHLKIPQDVIGAKATGEARSPATLRPAPDVTPDPDDIASAVRLLDEAGRITIFCGAGSRGAERELIELSERLKAPLVHTFRGKDLVAYGDPHWIGGLGLIGGKAGLDAVQGCDLLLMVGTDYPYAEFLPAKGKAIQIDKRSFVLGRRMPVELGIVGSARPTLRRLIEETKPKNDAAFFGKINKERRAWDEMLDSRAKPSEGAEPIHPPAVARRVSDLAADDAVFVIDTGNVTLWCGNWIRQTGRQRILASFNNAAVGTALGQANGIQALDRTRQVIACCGDGGFTMLMAEFMTAVQHKLPVKVVVFNNRIWGMVYLEMEGAGMPAADGASFPNCDFAAFARACGAEGFAAKSPAELDAALEAGLSSPGPVIIDVAVDPNELPSMPHIDPGQVARFGIAKIREAALSVIGR